jgi:hypothetical protein
MTVDEISRLKAIVDDHERRIQSLEQQQLISKAEVSFERDRTPGLEKLAQKSQVDPEKMDELFDVEGGCLTVLKAVGADEKEKTQNIALLTLMGYKYLVGAQEVLSGEIKRNVAENGVAVNNFSSHLNQMSPSLVRRKGKTRSPKTAYRLTSVGEVRARQLIKNAGEE